MRKVFAKECQNDFLNSPHEVKDFEENTAIQFDCPKSDVHLIMPIPNGFESQERLNEFMRYWVQSSCSKRCKHFDF